MPQLEYEGSEGSWKLTKHEIDNTTDGMKEAKVRFFVRVDTWKNACIQKGGYSVLTMSIKDPTGVSKKLADYQRSSLGGSVKAFETRDHLNEILKIVKKLLASINVNQRTEFSKFLKEFNSAVNTAGDLTGKKLFDELMEQKAGELNAQRFRNFCENVECSPEAYDAPIEFLTAVKDIQRAPNSWYLEHLRLIETFKIRENQQNCSVNLSDTERQEWVKAVDDNDANKADKCLVKLARQLKVSCYMEQFLRFWKAQKA